MCAARPLQKPWYMCLNMFIGMAGCLLPSLFLGAAAACRRKRAAPGGAREPLLAGDADASDADAGTAAPEARRPVKGLRGLLVVSAPTVRIAL